MPSSVNLDLNIQSYSPWRALMRLKDFIQRNQLWIICVNKGINKIIIVKRLEVKKGKTKLVIF